MALRKPSDFFGKEIKNDLPIVEEQTESFREELNKVENLSEQITQLQQELSQKVIQTDLEKLVLSQINSMQENFDFLQNDFKISNKKDIREFKEKVSELTDTVENLLEVEFPKYKKQITKNQFNIGEKLNELNQVVENNITNIRKELDEKLEDVSEVIDENLEYFNQQLQETSSEVKRTTDTYNKLSKIVESKVSKENEKLEEYSKTIKSLYESFVELQNSLKEETEFQTQTIDNKFESISSDISNKINDINNQVKNKIETIDEEVSDFKQKIYSNISDVKADVVINEKHLKKLETYIQENYQETQQEIINLREEVFDDNEKHLKKVETYIQENHQEIINLREEVFDEIEKIPVGNVQENIERLEKKIDFIRETYSKIEPEVIVKEVIKEGLVNIPPNEKTPDPLSPLDKNYVTLDQLQEHYRLFINRIQQQLSTIGGGGETRLKYLDDIVGIATNPSAYDGKFLKYNHLLGKFEFVTVSGGGGSQTLNDTLILGNTSSIGMSVGVVTATYFTGNGSLLTNISSASYAPTAGIATYATNSGIATYATSSGIATYATNAGVSTYATSAGIATYATNSGIATYATSAGIATYATNSGIATYATSAGIATYATNSGIATYATNSGIATYATSSGISTVSQNLTGSPNITVSSVNSTGIVTALSFNGTGTNLTSLNASNLSTGTVPSSRISASFGDFTVGQNLYVNGSLSIGGTSIILNAEQLQVKDKDIVVGYATDANNNEISNDNTANHGGISVASTVGNPIINIPLQSGINSNPSTYKQFMWIKKDNYLGMGTDAWVSNYAISIGNISSVQNGSRLTVGAGFTVYDTLLDATDIKARNINATGIVTASSFVGALTGTATSTTNIPNLTGDVTSSNTTTTLATVNSNVGTYGDAGAIPSITVNAKGLVTGVTTVAPNNGTLNLGVSGTGLSGSATFTANQSGSSTFTVTSNATDANTASTIVARDASGNFSAGTITANLTGNASSATYATSSGIATYATSAGIATYATSAGIATYATSSGIATYATTAGIATYATSSGISTYSTTAGIATYATSSGIATYATSAGIATYATSSGISTYATTAGIATYATSAGIATYATSAGISTTSQGLTGTPNISVGIVTATSYNGSGTNLTGIVTSIVAGSNITISGSTGQVTINSTTPNYWDKTSVGINTLSNVGIGTTNPTDALTVSGNMQILQNSGSTNRLVFRGQPLSSYRWNIDNNGASNAFRIFREDDATAANGSVAVSISTTGTVNATKFVGDGSGLTGIVASGSGIVIQNSGSTVGTATTINFSTNLTATFSGGVATVTATGGGGGTSTASIDLLEVMLFS